MNSHRATGPNHDLQHPWEQAMTDDSLFVFVLMMLGVFLGLIVS